MLGAMAMCACAVVALNSAPAAAQSVAYNEPVTFTGAMAAVLADEAALPLPVRQRKAALSKFYVDEKGIQLWREPAARQRLLDRLTNAAADGLDPSNYPIEVLARTTPFSRFAMGLSSSLKAEARAELYWSAFFLKFASDIKVGRILPTKVDTKLYWQAKEIDMVAALQLLAALSDLDKFLDAWQPQVPGYANLKKALAIYRGLEAAGGWQRLPVIQLLKPGETSDFVPLLRARLAVTDGVSPMPEAGADQVYSEDLVAAVKRFQIRHGLDPDGIIGKKSIFQLNVPADYRVRQIVLSMERWRWMPEDLGAHYIKINIAAYELRRVKAGKTLENMRVVVGKSYHQTPVFSRDMRYIEINPYWNVPYSIATKEELPKLKQNPAARAAKGFEAVSGDRAIPLTSIDWSKYSASNFPFRLRQGPGPGNALGRVKFMFPNRFNVYMHDTPARSLFAQAERAYSHGCIRLARPIDMAEQVLGDLPAWPRSRIDEVVASGKRTVVSLDKPLPVHITYSTAWQDEEGDVQFRPDIYGRDGKLYLALFGKPSPY